MPGARFPRAIIALSSLLLACAPLQESPSTIPTTSAQIRSESAAPATPPPLLAPEQRSGLQTKLDELLAAEFLAAAKVGVSIIALPSRQVIYQHHAEVPLNPASNAKLVTSAAALSVLGPQHRYITTVHAAADSVRDGIVHGDVYLRGGADPQLVTGNVYELARSLHADGIRSIRGRIVVDNSRFDHDGLPPGFAQKDEFASYRAPIGAASVNFNTVVIAIRPAPVIGEPIVIAVDPPVPSVEIHNEATTVDGKRNRLAVTAEHRDQALVVAIAGTLGAEAHRPTLRYPVADPSRYAGEVFAMALRDAGIRLRSRPIETGPVPEDATQLARHRSVSLAAHLRAVNKLSNNFMAEQILRSLVGDDGATADASLQIVRDYLGSTGLTDQAVSVGNGSGLYDNNRISCGAMTTLLAAVAADFRYAPEFMSSLSTMGIDGTTRRRLTDTPVAGWVRAKTGTLDGVSALSGYLGTADGRLFAFSIVMNDFANAHANSARSVQDEIVHALGEATMGELAVE